MAKQVINYGVNVNDGTGDTLRIGAQKINDNFTELYSVIGDAPVQQPADWLSESGVSRILNKPVLFSGSYDDLANRPALFSGSYEDLSSKPTIPTNTNQLTNGANFITSSSLVWNNISEKPSIPESLIDLGIVDGLGGYVLTTDGDGGFSFAEVGAMSSRNTASATTSVITNGSIEDVLITGFKSYALLKITTSHAAWVRIYTDLASRAADAERPEGSDPVPGAGVIAEVITTSGQTILISPGAFGFNNDDIINTSIPVTITNKSGVSAAITVTLTILQLEA
jgi:hypothetical protein